MCGWSVGLCVGGVKVYVWVKCRFIFGDIITTVDKTLRSKLPGLSTLPLAFAPAEAATSFCCWARAAGFLGASAAGFLGASAAGFLGASAAGFLGAGAAGFFCIGATDFF